ncbi:MAG: hydroxymethylbilane synthase [Chitinophagaceae bacterium]|nr:hydroxymethylbilane synthase [Chitinophagaceae bacterium]
MNRVVRIGTRESALAVWQATQVKQLLQDSGYTSELVFIKSEGDIDLKTPLYEMGVQGIFTRSLDIALLNDRIDIAVHSLKDVPTQLPEGIVQCAVLKRGSYKDLLVYRDKAAVDSLLPATSGVAATGSPFTIATSSIRRKAQWLNHYPGHAIENLRGNVNTRLKKLHDSNWHGAIFAAAGLERIGLRPENAIELDWMLPAPAQGAVGVVCRKEDSFILEACHYFNDADTELCTKIERDFLRALLGGCSTPISALAEIKNGIVFFKGNIFSTDGKEKVEIETTVEVAHVEEFGKKAAEKLLSNGGKKIADSIRNAGK